MLTFLFWGLTLTAGSAEVSDFLPLENLAVPESLGKIESKFSGTAGRWIIHIQDVHAHLTAQQNIAALLDHLNTMYGIKTIAIEGVWNDSTLPKSWGVPSSREKEMLAQALLEDDYINGAVYSAMFAKTPVHLVGLEQEPLYRENGKIYLNFLDHREDTLQKIGVLLHKIEAAKSNAYNPDLLTFDHSLTAFRDGKNAENFIPSLLAAAKSKEVDLQDLAQTKIFSETLEIQKSIDREKLRGEAQRLVETYKYRRLPFEELLQSGEVPTEKLEFYPNAKQYLKLIKTQEKISHFIFFEEIETAIERLKQKLLQTSEEKSLDSRSEAFGLARKIILLQATPSDLKAFEARQIGAAEDLEESGLNEALNNGLRFYEAAKKRDAVFFDKVINDPKLAGSIAVVTGGFHTDGLSERLEKAGVSHIVISPDLGKDEAVNEDIYRKRLRENLTASQTFTDLPPGALTDARDQGFEQGVKGLPAGRNIDAARNAYLSYRIGGPAKNVPLPSDQLDFAALSKAEREKIVQGYIDAQQSTRRIILVIRQSELKELLKDPVALTIWRTVILSNRQNTVVIINDQMDDSESVIFTDTEGDAKIQTARGSITTVLAQQRIKTVGKRALIGVIDSEYKPTAKDEVVLPRHAATLLLLRVILEQLEQATQIDLNNTEALNLIEIIVKEIYERQGALLTSA